MPGTEKKVSVRIRPFRESDIAEDYHRWVNDPEVLKYMSTTPGAPEAMWKQGTMADLRRYYQFMSGSPYHRLFAIVAGEKHVGNITLNNIRNGEADSGILLGREHWGKGYGSEAVSLMLEYAFNMLHLKRVWLGVETENERAIRVYRKAGFKECAYIMEVRR